MIGLDTNVLVRYFAQDDEIQSKKATALMESLSPERPGYVSQVALIEVVWVLGRCYGVEREQDTHNRGRSNDVLEHYAMSVFR